MASRRWFQFRLATIFVVVTIVACSLALWPRIRAYRNVRSISNADVQVDGGTLGLMVQLDTPAANALRKQGPGANSALFAELRDKDRFAAAHVLLTDINDKHKYISAGEWNGLRVTLHADGRVDFHPEQIPQLEAKWTERLYSARR
jgi:hypothetical protein